uniref:FH2 domain-containing protein n=1 Tax=Apteryx owenii TaxID=8824 RepID=A0A8B9PEW3_APTOW
MGGDWEHWDQAGMEWTGSTGSRLGWRGLGALGAGWDGGTGSAGSRLGWGALGALGAGWVGGTGSAETRLEWGEGLGAGMRRPGPRGWEHWDQAGMGETRGIRTSLGWGRWGPGNGGCRGGHDWGRARLIPHPSRSQVCKEKHRFERLMEYFRNEDSSIDFMVACMQFINIVVHSVEDMNFRVHLQYEFTKLGLEEFLQKSRHTESEKLQVQIQAYLDNVFDVGGLLEDAETKNVALEKVEELEEHLSHVRERGKSSLSPGTSPLGRFGFPLRGWRWRWAADGSQNRGVPRTGTSLGLRTLKGGSQNRGSPGAGAFPPGHALTLSSPSAGKCPPAPPLPGASPSIALTVGLSAIRIKKPIKTKFRLPVFNWTALKPNQISGTVFSELDDERVLEDLDLERFEELFKTKAQGPALDLVCAKNKASHKAASKVTLLEANRAKNLAITLRKAGRSAEEICRAIHTFDLATLPVDFVECLMRFLPTEAEAKALRQYERERKPLDELADEDRFMLQFSKVERLPQRMAIMAFLGNFAENLQMLTPQLNAIIAASASVKSSQKLKHMLEIILALGNYMNSSKRGAVYGFKLQSLDLLLDTKSTDRKMTLLHFIALTVREKYPELATFWQELHFVEKAAAVSLENVLLDVKELGRGMELLRRECGLHENSVLRSFLAASEGKLERLQKDARTAEVRAAEPPLSNTTPPSLACWQLRSGSGIRPSPAPQRPHGHAARLLQAQSCRPPPPHPTDACPGPQRQPGHDATPAEKGQGSHLEITLLLAQRKPPDSSPGPQGKRLSPRDGAVPPGMTWALHPPRMGARTCPNEGPGLCCPR